MSTNPSNNKISLLQIAIIILTLATALIHIILAIPSGMGLFLFYLNGIGYLVLVAGLYAPPLQKYQTATRWALIIFTGITIMGWVFIGERSLVGYTDKLIEIVLIILLFIDGRQSR